MSPAAANIPNLHDISEVQGGARFFDGKKRDLGWAAKVSKRHPTLGGLTVLDVAAIEPSLASSLRLLDKARLLVQCTGASGESYAFAWASGYANGADVRIQGRLEG
jgi:hypothetical protein